MKVLLSAVCVMAGLAGIAGVVTAADRSDETSELKARITPHKKQRVMRCDGGVHTRVYCAVVWHRDKISDIRAQLTDVRADKLAEPLKLKPVSYSLPKLKKSMHWHERLLGQAKRLPEPTLYRQAAYYAVNELRYPAREWNCLAQIPRYEGAWQEVGVQFGHRHLPLSRALSYPFGPWQANPGRKIMRYGNPMDIRAQVRWVIAYARKFGGGCGALNFRLSHNYW